MSNYRHGDLALIGIEKLPEGMVATKTKVLMEGSHGNAHTINKGKVYLKDANEYVFGYLEAKGTILSHAEHGEGKEKVARIEDGVYELRKQQEKTHEGMKPVID